MQVTGFKWKKDTGIWQPYFILNNGQNQRFALWSSPINMTVGEKFCAGHVVDGSYTPCPNKAQTEAMLCEACKGKDDFFLCVQCKGDECHNHKQRPDCEQGDYVMYLASFDTLLKVGISREARFHERLIEQGADFGTKIARVKDGLYVRKMEQIVSNYIGCPDRVSGEIKQQLLFGDPNASSTQVVKAVAKLKDAHWDFPIQPEIYDFRSYYKLDEVGGMPRKLPIDNGTEIKGRVVATKGNIVVIKNPSGTFSFDARKVIGRQVLSINYDFSAPGPQPEGKLTI